MSVGVIMTLISCLIYGCKEHIHGGDLTCVIKENFNADLVNAITDKPSEDKHLVQIEIYCSCEGGEIYLNDGFNFSEND